MKLRIASLVASAIMAAALVGCSPARLATIAPPHPNQVSALDGQAYDLLLGANAAIVKAEQDVRAGSLPADKWVPVINEALRAYNLTQGAWMTYRDAVKATPADAKGGTEYNQLVADMYTLTTSISALTKGH